MNDSPIKYNALPSPWEREDADSVSSRLTREQMGEDALSTRGGYSRRLSSKFLPAILMLCLLFPARSQAQTIPQYQQGYTQYQYHEFDSALTSFNQLIAAQPGKKEGYYNRGLCYYQLNRLAESQQDFNICLQIDSVFDDARFMKALILQRQGEWQAADIEIKKLNTTYAGYNELKKRIKYHHMSVSLSKNWCYMIAIMFMFIILVGVIAKSYSVKKG